MSRGPGPHGQHCSKKRWCWNQNGRVQACSTLPAALGQMEAGSGFALQWAVAVRNNARCVRPRGAQLPQAPVVLPETGLRQGCWPQGQTDARHGLAVTGLLESEACGKHRQEETGFPDQRVKDSRPRGSKRLLCVHAASAREARAQGRARKGEHPQRGRGMWSVCTGAHSHACTHTAHALTLVHAHVCAPTCAHPHTCTREPVHTPLHACTRTCARAAAHAAAHAAAWPHSLHRVPWDGSVAVCPVCAAASVWLATEVCPLEAWGPLLPPAAPAKGDGTGGGPSYRRVSSVSGRGTRDLRAQPVLGGSPESPCRLMGRCS